MLPSLNEHSVQNAAIAQHKKLPAEIAKAIKKVITTTTTTVETSGTPKVPQTVPSPATTPSLPTKILSPTPTTPATPTTSSTSSTPNAAVKLSSSTTVVTTSSPSSPPATVLAEDKTPLTVAPAVVKKKSKTAVKASKTKIPKAPTALAVVSSSTVVVENLSSPPTSPVVPEPLPRTVTTPPTMKEEQTFDRKITATPIKTQKSTSIALRPTTAPPAPPSPQSSTSSSLSSPSVATAQQQQEQQQQEQQQQEQQQQQEEEEQHQREQSPPNKKPSLLPKPKVKVAIPAAVLQKRQQMQRRAAESQQEAQSEQETIVEVDEDEEKDEAEEVRDEAIDVKTGDETVELSSGELAVEKHISETSSPPPTPSSRIPVRTAKAEKRALQAAAAAAGITNPDEVAAFVEAGMAAATLPHSTNAAKSKAMINAEKRASWRAARLRSLEQGAVEAQNVIKNMNKIADDLLVQPSEVKKIIFPKIAIKSSEGPVIIREREKILDEKIVRRTEEIPCPLTGLPQIRTVEYIEKIIETEVETCQEKIISLELQDPEKDNEGVSYEGSPLSTEPLSLTDVTALDDEEPPELFKETTQDTDEDADENDDDDDDDEEDEDEDEDEDEEEDAASIVTVHANNEKLFLRTDDGEEFSLDDLDTSSIFGPSSLESVSSTKLTIKPAPLTLHQTLAKEVLVEPATAGSTSNSSSSTAQTIVEVINPVITGEGHVKHIAVGRAEQCQYPSFDKDDDVEYPKDDDLDAKAADYAIIGVQHDIEDVEANDDVLPTSTGVLRSETFVFPAASASPAEATALAAATAATVTVAMQPAQEELSLNAKMKTVLEELLENERVKLNLQKSLEDDVDNTSEPPAYGDVDDEIDGSYGDEVDYGNVGGAALSSRLVIKAKDNNGNQELLNELIRDSNRNTISKLASMATSDDEDEEEEEDEDDDDDDDDEEEDDTENDSDSDTDGSDAEAVHITFVDGCQVIENLNTGTPLQKSGTYTTMKDAAAEMLKAEKADAERAANEARKVMIDLEAETVEAARAIETDVANTAQDIKAELAEKQGTVSQRLQNLKSKMAKNLESGAAKSAQALEDTASEVAEKSEENVEKPLKQLKDKLNKKVHGAKESMQKLKDTTEQNVKQATEDTAAALSTASKSVKNSVKGLKSSLSRKASETSPDRELEATVEKLQAEQRKLEKITQQLRKSVENLLADDVVIDDVEDNIEIAPPKVTKTHEVKIFPSGGKTTKTVVTEVIKRGGSDLSTQSSEHPKSEHVESGEELFNRLLHAGGKRKQIFDEQTGETTTTTTTTDTGPDGSTVVTTTTTTVANVKTSGIPRALITADETLELEDNATDVTEMLTSATGSNVATAASSSSSSKLPIPKTPNNKNGKQHQQQSKQSTNSKRKGKNGKK